MRSLAGAALMLVLACSSDAVSPTATCPVDPFSHVVPADTGWRARVHAVALSLPGDTAVVLLVGYRDSVTAADREELQNAGATITSEWDVIPGVAIMLTAAELVALSGSLPDTRVEFAELSVPVCIQPMNLGGSARPRAPTW